MTLPKYLSYWEDNCFSFFLKFVLLQFKFIPAEFKYRRDSNGLKIQFRTLTKTDPRIHFTSYVFMYLCLPIWAPFTGNVPVMVPLPEMGNPISSMVLRLLFIFFVSLLLRMFSHDCMCSEPPNARTNRTESSSSTGPDRCPYQNWQSPVPEMGPSA